LARHVDPKQRAQLLLVLDLVKHDSPAVVALVGGRADPGFEEEIGALARHVALPFLGQARLTLDFHWPRWSHNPVITQNSARIFCSLDYEPRLITAAELCPRMLEYNMQLRQMAITGSKNRFTDWTL